MVPKNAFRSFWMAGFECSDQLNHYGNRVDLLSETGHIPFLEKDYDLIASQGFKTVREGMQWSKVEKAPYHYDFSQVGLMIKQGKKKGIQQIWDICHFGFPDDLSPLHPHFKKRFVGVCKAFVCVHRSLVPELELIITPINEVGFLSWLGGDHASTSPYARGMGWDVKYALIDAYIQAIKAMKAIDPNVKIMTTEPLVNIVPPHDADIEQILDALRQHEEQYQATDMLFGRICPEMGGNPDLVDYIGYNFYYNNQWVANTFETLPWANVPADPRWKNLSDLLYEAYSRYKKDIVVSETSHPGEHRPNWIARITLECIEAVRIGLPLQGLCIYPIIDRPDWDHLHCWHHSGLWDADEHHPYARMLNIEYAIEIQKSMKILNYPSNNSFATTNY